MWRSVYHSIYSLVSAWRGKKKTIFHIFISYMWFLFRKPTGMMSSIVRWLSRKRCLPLKQTKTGSTAWSKLTSCVSSHCTTMNVTNSARNGVSCLQAIGSNIMCIELLPCLLEFLGCGQLFVTDGLWKLDYPVCIYKVPVEVKGMNVRRYKTICLHIQHPLLTILFCTGSTSWLLSQWTPSWETLLQGSHWTA